ncbi:hypothetical protein [Streptomyces sp. NPDC006335]|uniref:hypothetical protein n=1 Tax=Streptomyces sp. NPDC006335 TaxID=3156895 RepID=UPI0033B15F07
MRGALLGSAEIAEARAMARDFLTSVHAVHGLYAPGPCLPGLPGLEIVEGPVQIRVWDSSTTLPSIQYRRFIAEGGLWSAAENRGPGLNASETAARRRCSRRRESAPDAHDNPHA